MESVELMISPSDTLAWLRFEKFEAEGLVKCCNAWSRDQKQKVRRAQPGHCLSPVTQKKR